VSDRAFSNPKVSEHDAVEIASRHAMQLGDNLLEVFFVRTELGPRGWTVIFFPRSSLIKGGDVRVVVDGESGVVQEMIVGQ
jgi:hypothetical protein